MGLAAKLRTDWPAFVINLDRSVERMRLFTQEVERVGLSFIRQPAIDGQTIERATSQLCDAATIVKACDADLSDGELGCYLSHIALWQTALSPDTPWVLVLEDDATIDGRLLSILANVHRLPDDWEILILQRASAKMPFLRRRFLPNIDVLRHLHVGYFATGYLIHRRALDRLRHHLLPVRWPIDHWDRWWAVHGLVVYRTDADLVVQNTALESTMRRALPGAIAAPSPTVRRVLARRVWRSKVKLLRLLRLSYVVLAVIGKRLQPKDPS